MNHSWKKWLKPVAFCKDIDSGKCFVEVEIKDKAGAQTKTRLNNEWSAKLSSARDFLLSIGIDAAPDDVLRELQAVFAWSGRPVIELTQLIGWKGDNPDTFLLPDGSVGKETNIRFSEMVDVKKHVRGSLERWREAVSHPISRSSYLLFSVALGFAGPLLRSSALSEGAIFHMYGKTTTGKTTCALAALSVWSAASRPQIDTHSQTNRHLEESAARSNDGLLILDEIGRLGLSGQKMEQYQSDLAYFAGGGKGKQRSKSVTSMLPGLRNVEYLMFGMSSGEKPLDGIKERKGGETVRLIGIPVPEQMEGGIFDREPDMSKHRAIAEKLEKDIEQQYGTPIRAFLKELVHDGELAHKLEKYTNRFMRREVVTQNPYALRFANKFAVVYAAAALSADYGVGPWSKKEAHESIAKVYRDAWLLVRPVSCATDDLVDWLATSALDEQLFPLVESTKAVSPKLAGTVFGVRRSVGGIRVLAVFRARLEEIVGAADEDAVLSELKKRGILMPGKTASHNVRQLRIGGLNNERTSVLMVDFDRLPALPKKSES